MSHFTQASIFLWVYITILRLKSSRNCFLTKNWSTYIIISQWSKVLVWWTTDPDFEYAGCFSWKILKWYLKVILSQNIISAFNIYSMLQHERHLFYQTIKLFRLNLKYCWHDVKPYSIIQSVINLRNVIHAGVMIETPYFYM